MKEQAWQAIKHIHAQDAAWFLLFVFAIICVVLYRDWRKEKNDE